ncbi:MAG: beta-propeller fold lactonase family protein, partial [Nitrospirota bacterium]
MKKIHLASIIVSFLVSISIGLYATAALGNELWVTNQKDNTISIIESGSNEVIATIPAKGDFPHNVTFSKDGKLAYVANVGSNNVNVFNTETRELTATI